jgi:hypothetical protein
MKNLYTKPEIILCTFIARFGRKHFNEADIAGLKGRSESSIILKVMNIASMLLEGGYSASKEVSSLTGKPSGQKGRRTNWDVVMTLVDLSENEMKNQCFGILAV